MTDNNLQERFLTVFEQNTRIVIKIARAYTQTIQDREDLINDIALELWKSFDRFKGESKISTWIYRVALNTSMNFNRRKKRTGHISFYDPLLLNASEQLTDQDDSSQAIDLYDCINALNALNKAIILLYLDGNSHEEISTVTGITKTNVGTRIGRIKDQIRNLLITKK
ncbi:MAG: sigma-70 family RNA polymerase sigma factor [Bacteroidales bacterium]|nr:sigma-70 family RNA polymerase sigma factor [Bacteroidales bacterium]